MRLILLLSFAVASFLLVGFFHLYFYLSVSSNEQNMHKVTQLKEYVSDIQFLIRIETISVSDIFNAPHTNQLSEYWTIHQASAKEFDQKMKDFNSKLIQIKTNDLAELVFDEQKFRLKLKNFDLLYNESILPLFMQMYNIKWDELAKNNSTENANLTEQNQTQTEIDELNFEESEGELTVESTVNSKNSLHRQFQVATDELFSIRTDILALEASLEQKSQELTKLSFVFIGGFVLSSLIILVWLTFAIIKSIENQLQAISDNIVILTNGSFPTLLNIKTKGIIRTIVRNLNRLTENFQNTKRIIENVGKEIFDIKINVFEKDSTLRLALEEMQNSLHKVTQERALIAEVERRNNWKNTGIAEFAEMLRNPGGDINELSYALLLKLMRYTHSEVGGFFLINTDEHENISINLSSCVAYNRKRLLQKSFAVGEGLVGRCIEEKKKIYITDVPSDYLEIQSGTGQEAPRNVLIVPMIFNNEIFGAIEIASFVIYDAYVVSFIETISESISATIRFMKNSMKTQKLLEQTKIQAQEIAAQEEVLRQNMEEMQATQEEAQRKEKLSIGFSNTVNHTLIRADFDTFGRFLYGNSLFLDAMGYKTREVMGMDISMFLFPFDVERIGIVINNIAKGGSHFEGEIRYKTKKGAIWLMTTLTAVRNDEGNVEQLLLLALNIDYQKK